MRREGPRGKPKKREGRKEPRESIAKMTEVIYERETGGREGKLSLGKY